MEYENIEEINSWKEIDVSDDFQKRASNFDKMSRWVMDKNINNIPFELLLHRKELGDLFDAGGGTGYLSFYLTNRMPATSITIVDASTNMLLKAKERIPNAIVVNKSIEDYCSVEKRKFDTILARQIFHYVDDVNLIISLLKEKLKENGILYVGQFVVLDKETSTWNNSLMQKISHSRKRSLVISDFVNLFIQNGFKVVRFITTNYEENLKDFYNRRTNNEISYDKLLSDMIALVSENIKEKMSVKVIYDNMFFSYQFCHMTLIDSKDISKK